MAERIDGLEVAIGLDASHFKSELDELGKLGDAFGASLTKAFTGAVTGGKALGDVMRSLALSLSSKALSAALQPLGDGLGGLFSSLFGAVLPSARGNVVANGVLKPFAQGGVVGGPTVFPMRGGNVGLMGEAGAEAIMPLARGADGRLGVRAEGGGRAVTLNLNIQAQDAESFRRSQSQVAALVSRAVDRGMRNL